MSQERTFIAIVDDEESVRRALMRLMLSASMEVQTFSGGSEFLASLSVRRPDCVILDLHMPSMSGFEVLECLGQSGHAVPAITITGHDAPGSEMRVRQLGAAAYLHKPVAASVLLAAIKSATGAP